MITSHILKTQTDYFNSPCILCGQSHTAITEEIDITNKLVTTCINCPIIIRTDPPNTPFDKAFNFRWCPSKLASNYGYQPDDVTKAWLELKQTRYARILVSNHSLDRILNKALRACELERTKCTFKRSSPDEEEHTEILI
jgi:hypothetical protein